MKNFMAKLLKKEILKAIILSIFFVVFIFVLLTSFGGKEEEIANRPIFQNTTVPIRTTSEIRSVNVSYEAQTQAELSSELTDGNVEILSTDEIYEDTARIEKTLKSEVTQTKKPEPSSTPKITQTKTNKVMTITIPQLAIRKFDSTEYSVLGFINYGETFTLLGKTGTGWHKIKYKNVTGYVDGKYVVEHPLKITAVTTDTPMFKTPSPAIITTPPVSPQQTTDTQTPPEETTNNQTTYDKTQQTQLPESHITDISTQGTQTISIQSMNTTLSSAQPGEKYIQTNYVNPYIKYTYTQLMKDVEKITDYYDFIETGEIGKSTLGRSIPYIKLGKGSKKIFICASVHAREYMTTAYIMKIIENYAYYYANDITFGTFRVKKMLDTYSLWVVPMVNPDGVAIATEPQNVDIPALAKIVGNNWVTPDVLVKWKANGRGVDLNNNFNCAWSGMSLNTTFPAYMSYKGTTAESESETKAVISFCRKYNFEASISLHSKGEIIYWDDAISKGKVPKAQTFVDAMCNLTGYVRMPTTTSANGYGGGFENWFRKEFKKPSVCVELTPGTGGEIPHDPKNFDSLIWQKSKYLPLIAIQSLM